MSLSIEKVPFNSSQILEDLRKESTRGKEFENIIKQYEQGMTNYNNTLKRFLQYGVNEIDILQNETDKNDSIDNQSSPSRSPSIQQDQGGFYNQQQIERSKSTLTVNPKKDADFIKHSQTYKQLKQKFQKHEEQYNILLEQNERMNSQLETLTEESVKLNDQVKMLSEQNAKQIQSLLQKDDLISKLQQDLQKLRDIELRHVETIQTIKEQLEKKIEQVTTIEADRNQLLERYILEKSQFAEKMNQLNGIQEELNQKMSKLSEDEEYLVKRKLNFQTEVQKSGVKMPTLAPTLDEAKIILTNSEVPQKPSKILLKQHKNEIYCIGQSLNGSIIATCGGDNTIKLFDPITMSQQGSMQSARDDNLFLHLNFAPFQELLIAGLSDKTVQLFNYSTCKLRSTFQGHNERVNVVTFTSEKEKVASGSTDRSIKIWDINKGSSIKTIVCGSIPRAIDYFQSEPHIVTGHNDGSIRLYSTRDTSNTKPIYNVQEVFDSGVTCTKLSNCQNYVLASSSEGFSVKVVDLRKSQVVKTFENQSYFNNHEFNKVCFGPDDKYVIAGCADSTIFIWNFANGTKKSILKNTNHQGVIVAVDFHNVSGNLYSGDSRGNLLIWN